MKVSSRGVGNAALLTICVLVLVGFIIVVAWAMGEVLTSLVGGLAEDGAAGSG